MEPRVLAAYRGSPRGAMRLTGIFRSIIRIGITENAEESHAPNPLGGEPLMNRNFLQSIRIDGWLVLSNHQKLKCPAEQIRHNIFCIIRYSCDLELGASIRNKCRSSAND